MKNKLITLLILFIVFGSSCKKFLEREPKNQMTDQNTWTSEAEANSEVSSMYALFRAAINYPEGIGHFMWGDLTADEFSPTQSGADYTTVNSINWQISVSSSAATNDSRPLYRLRIWNNFYRAIDQANRVLKFVPEVDLSNYTSTNPASVQQKFLGEAYFMRALTYFYISRIWGDVPLSLQTYTDPTQSPRLPRTPAAQVLDQAIKDVQDALPKLAWTTSPASDKAVRATKGAAFALLAHIYAWKGDYANAASAADSVILKGGYSYVPRASVSTIFKGQSSEGIFEISENKINEGYGTAGIGARTSKAPYYLANTGNSVMPLDQGNLYSRFFTDTANDLRAKKGMAFLGTTDPITIKYSDPSFITYTAANNTSPVFLHNIIIFRLADIKLLRAEALAATGNTGGARTILNEVRTQAGLAASTATDANLFEAIIDERGRELFLEGHRFYDLVRLAKKTGIVKFGSGSTPRITTSEFSQGKYIWPIDPSLIIANPSLTQTPYWLDKM